MKYFFILDFIIFQIVIFFYSKYLLKNKITPGTISALGAVGLFKLVCIYHLLTKQPTSKIIYEYLIELFNI